MLLTAAVVAKIRQRPAASVLLLRGVAKGESAARLARELDLSRKHLHILRRLQANPDHTPPTAVMSGTTFDELSQNAGIKSMPHPDATVPPRRP
jgi:hypothetical protein